MVLGWLGSAASQITSPMLAAVHTLAGAPGEERNGNRKSRTHLESRGLHQPGTGEVAQAVEQRLGDLDGVGSVEVNGVLGRVTVTRDPGTVTSATLARLLGDVESEYGLVDRTASTGANQPGNAGNVLLEACALGADMVGLGYVAATSLLPVRALPSLAPAALSLVNSVPWLHESLENRLGKPTTDSALAAATTVAQTLARSPTSLIVDGCQRFYTTNEAVPRYQAWQRWEGAVSERSGMHRAEALEDSPRPRPLPDGPVERVANTSGTLALAGYGTVLALTRSPQRALATLLAGIPRASKAGREAFSAHLTSIISTRGNLVVDTGALRRLDRVSAVVLDVPTLASGRQTVETVISPGEQADAAEEPPLPVEALVEAARTAGCLVVAGTDNPAGHRLGLDRTVSEGDRLLESVRQLQSEGHVVAVVSAGGRSALAAADVGLGLSDETGALPWGAHIMCPSVAEAWTLLAAVDNARTASRNGAVLSVAGSCLGVLSGTLGPALGAPDRASIPGHAAALLALGLGTWSGMRATGRPPPAGLEHTPTSVPVRPGAGSAVPSSATIR